LNDRNWFFNNFFHYLILNFNVIHNLFGVSVLYQRYNFVNCFLNLDNFRHLHYPLNYFFDNNGDFHYFLSQSFYRNYLLLNEFYLLILLLNMVNNSFYFDECLLLHYFLLQFLDFHNLWYLPFYLN
jgi:hypothetical protein